MAQPVINLQAGVNPEKITSYEAGGKIELFDRQLQINFAGFVSKYRDQQVFTFSDGAAALLNAGKATMSVIEIETTFSPRVGLLSQLGATFLDSQYD